jgi:YD repeat-containing protein
MPKLIVPALVTILLVMLVHQPLDAQVCYSYDGLGRLTGVIDQQGQAAIYRHDAVGNIVTIERRAAGGPVAIVAFDPSGGVAGAQVEILGRGFSNVAAQNQVTIGGTGASVLLATPCRLTVEVPAGVMSGTIQVTTPAGSAVATTPFAAFTMAFDATAPVQIVGTSQQFRATIGGCGDPRVVWSVNGIVGGNAAVGTITEAGVYTAPASEPSSFTVTIRADSFTCPGLFAVRNTIIMGRPNVTVAGPPALAVLPALGTPGGLGPNITVGNPSAQMVLPGPGGTGGLGAGVTVGVPPVSVILPAEGVPGALAPNVTVANPPVSIEFEP